MAEGAIWVVAEQRQGRLAPVGLELAGKALALAQPLGWQTCALLLGRQVGPLAQELLQQGVDQVLVADHPLLADYCNQAQVKVISQAVAARAPQVILLGATAQGTDLGPRLAAHLRTGLSAHAVDLELDPQGRLLAVVPGWGGGVMAKISCPRHQPQMATVMPGTFEAPVAPGPRGQVIELAVELSPADLTYKVRALRQEEAIESDLDQAQVVVAGGWGVGKAQDWGLVRELAAALGGAVGATRPAVDEGWAAESQMIGTSGRSVSPKLYIGVALSGNPHHMVGIKKPGFSVGINQDPQAPLFDHCDLGLTGDFREIIPALLKQIRP